MPRKRKEILNATMTPFAIVVRPQQLWRLVPPVQPAISMGAALSLFERDRAANPPSLRHPAI
jgi:hypothetical protein